MPWLASSLLASALVVARPVPAMDPATVTTEDTLACDDAMTGGTLVQQAQNAYGNRFELACAGARLRSASFVHFGAGVEGPYAYRLRLFDADCVEKGATEILSAPSAAEAPASVDVDLEALGWCVASDFVLALEPLECAEPDDCFPALAIDSSSDGDGNAHCGVLVALATGTARCLAPRSADGRYFDFRLRVTADCADPACTSAVAPRTWSSVKRLYADPRP